MAQAEPSLATRNAEVFRITDIADWYVGGDLAPPESALLIDRRGDFAGKRVLDLGVGAGRTTPHIQPRAAAYLGIDASFAMLARARMVFPQAEFRFLDLRDLNLLPEGQYDYALASFCLMDMFEPLERAQTIAAIRRVLAPGGLFVFSTHNLAWREAGVGPRVRWSTDPLRFARDLRQYLIGQRNYRARAGQERRLGDRAILRDMAHQWRCVFHYIQPRAQIEDLDRLGFDVLDMFGVDGRRLTIDDDVSGDCDIHFRCRRRD